VRLDFSGAPEIAAPPAEVWKRLLDHEFVASVAPGVESVEPIDDRHFKVISGFGVGAVKVRFQLDVELSDEPQLANMAAAATIAEPKRKVVRIGSSADQGTGPVRPKTMVGLMR